MSSYEVAEVKEMLRKGVSPNKVARMLGLNIKEVHLIAEGLTCSHIAEENEGGVMAVKIIGEDATKIKRTTCPSCAAVLEYTLADTTTESIPDYTGWADTYRFLKCPRCTTPELRPMANAG